MKLVSGEVADLCKVYNSEKRQQLTGGRGWWLGNGLMRVSSVIAQPWQWSSYFLFSVSASPDAGAAHVGTDLTWPLGGNAEAEKQLSLGWAP